MKHSIPPAACAATTREAVLANARNCVCGRREEDYGKPEDNFTRIADYWSVYLDYPVYPQDVANMMILLKIARAGSGAPTFDSYVDIAGYAACAGEIISAEPPENGTLSGLFDGTEGARNGETDDPEAV